MKIFITGATGFVGQNVLKEISNKKHHILASSRYTKELKYNFLNIQWLYGDLSNIEKLKPKILTFNPDIVIHLAWQDIPDYSNVTSVINLNNSIQFFDFIINKTNCKKIIVSGSCYEYGKEFGECDEDENMKIKSFFSWAKISLYQYLILKTKENDIDLIWFRIFYVYGSGQRDESLIPFLIKSFTNYETPQIKLPGNKNDFIHIQDVAKAIGNAVHIKSESGIYNLGYGESNSVIDICRLVEKNISKNSGITDRIKVNDKKTDINFWANIEKTKLAFDWEPVVTLKKGIATYFD